MTRVALYARYSSENQKDSSIDDQYRNCERYAQREGWQIVARFEDKAISGSTTARAQYQQLLKDAKAKLFDVVLVDDFSRLSRDTIESEQVRRRMIHWGIRLIGVSDGIDTSQEGHELIHGVKGIVNSTFLKDLKAKIKRGMEGQAAKCFWQGGRVYGYRLVPEYDPLKKNCYGEPAKIGTRLEIDPEQAQWIKWIFEQYANGRSPLNIVTELNERGVAPPGAVYQYKKRPRTPTWRASALHGELQRGTGLLNNQLYRGLYRWNRSYRMKDPETGTATNAWRDQTDWIMTEEKALRIVDEDLWERAHQRRVAVSQSAQALNTSKGIRGAGTGRSPKYLFSGLLVCGQCGSNMIIASSTDYACSLWRYGGATKHTCTNTLTASRTVVESRLLKAIQDDLFTEEGLEVFRQEFERYLVEQRKVKTSNTTHAQGRLIEVEREITNIMHAIKQGIITPTTKAMLMEAEVERERLRQVVRVDNNSTLLVSVPNLMNRFQRMLDDLARAARQEIDKARSIIHSLVGERKIVLRPTGDYLTAELAGDYAGLIPLVYQGKIKLVAVTRIERATRGLGKGYGVLSYAPFGDTGGICEVTRCQAMTGIRNPGATKIKRRPQGAEGDSDPLNGIRG